MLSEYRKTGDRSRSSRWRPVRNHQLELSAVRELVCARMRVRYKCMFCGRHLGKCTNTPEKHATSCRAGATYILCTRRYIDCAPRTVSVCVGGCVSATNTVTTHMRSTTHTHSHMCWCAKTRWTSCAQCARRCCSHGRIWWIIKVKIWVVQYNRAVRDEGWPIARAELGGEEKNLCWHNIPEITMRHDVCECAYKRTRCTHSRTHVSLEPVTPFGRMPIQLELFWGWNNYTFVIYCSVIVIAMEDLINILQTI